MSRPPKTGKTTWREERQRVVVLLREARERAGLSQGELAAKLRRERSYVSKLKRGVQGIEVVELLDHCRAVGVTPGRVGRAIVVHNGMDPLLETNPAEFWKRFRREKSLEELAVEQGARIPASFDGYLADVMPSDETPEMWNARIEEWRDEDRQRTNGDRRTAPLGGHERHVLPVQAPYHPKTLAYREILEGHTLSVSFMTVGELWRGVDEAGWGEKRRNDLRLYLERYIVATATANLGETWGTLMALSKRAGRNLGHADAWIAATALTRDVPLVSDNVRHFEWIPGLRLLSA